MYVVLQVCINMLFTISKVDRICKLSAHICKLIEEEMLIIIALSLVEKNCKSGNGKIVSVTVHKGGKAEGRG